MRPPDEPPVRRGISPALGGEVRRPVRPSAPGADWAAPARGQATAPPAAEPRTRVRDGVIGSIMFALGLLAYLGVQQLAVPARTLESSWDRAIPFVPQMILAYVAFFPFVLIAVFRMRPDRFRRVVVAAVLAVGTAWLCFLLYPASIARPEPAEIDGGLWRAVFLGLHWLDDSHNTFPSLHVAVSWICGLGLCQRGRVVTPLVAAAVISLSTLFVKQHVVVDAAGGFVLGLASYGVAVLVLRAVGRDARGPARQEAG